MLEFPHSLLREAVTDRPRLVGAARTGGRSASGVITMSRTDGGGLWAYGLQSIAVTTADHVLQFELITTLMAEGTRPIIVPICDKRHFPAPIVDGEPVYSLDLVPHSDGSPFSDSSLYAHKVVLAWLSVPAALRATTITIGIETMGTLRGGELFSIDHQTLGWRFYRVVGVVSQTATTATIRIEPPLREATAANALLEFDYPRCVMQLAEPVSLQLQLRRFGRPSVSFIESFLPLD